MELDEYLERVDLLAKRCIDSSLSVSEYVNDALGNLTPEIEELVDFGVNLLTPADVIYVTPFLPIGYFQRFTGERRLACFNLCFQIEEAAAQLRIRRACEPYALDQPIFSNGNDLWNALWGLELIDMSLFKQIEDSHIVTRANRFYTLSPFLHPVILSWSQQHFPNAKTFVRLDPFIVSSRMPPQRFLEAIVMPANPNWWRHLQLRRNEVSGSQYLLQETAPTSGNTQEFWDYKVKGVRKLEVFVRRDGKGNLSMLIEEVKKENKRENFSVARCVHLDTIDPPGTSFDSSTLAHLDLAINVYWGPNQESRLETNIASGELLEADFRTHLFRTEKVPFDSVLSFAWMFLDSKFLTTEWIVNQFHPA